MFLSCWLPAAPASAATMVATVTDAQSVEHELRCNPSVPGPCTTRYFQRLRFDITVSNFSGSRITFDFDLEGITATEGQDFKSFPYSPPFKITTGTDGRAQIVVDTIVDSVAEATETFRVRLTSASQPVDISDTGLGTILDGSQLPADCSAYVIDVDTSYLACGGRPAAQQWRSRFGCGGWGPWYANGNTVTGNGTSTATCVFDEPWMTGEVLFVIVAP